jgi:hypothetical protein
VGAQASGTWLIGDVQLEKGSIATPPDPRSYGQELSLCQRYYENAPFAIIGVSPNSGVSIGNWIQFAQPKRAVPTPAATALQNDPAITSFALDTPDWTTRITEKGYLASASAAGVNVTMFYHGAMMPMSAEL